MPALAVAFDRDIEAFEEERTMPFTTARERHLLESGEAAAPQSERREAYFAGIEALLDARFGAEGLALMPVVRTAFSPAVLLQAIREGPDLDAVRKLLPPLPG